MARNKNNPYVGRDRNKAEPDVCDYIDVVRKLETARTRIYDDPAICESGFRDVSAAALSKEYGMTERSVVRAIGRGVEHYERRLQRKFRRTLPSLALRPASISGAEMDFLFYAIQDVLEDAPDLDMAEIYTSPVVRRRMPQVQAFDSAAHMARTYAAWAKEYHDHGIGLSRALAERREIYGSR